MRLIAYVFGFGVAGVWLAGKPDFRVIGWVSILFFGCMLPLSIWQMIDKHPRLRKGVALTI